jgi:hypothetical protein
LLVVLADGREEKKRWGWRKEKKVGRLLQSIAVHHWRSSAYVALLCVGLEPPESGDWNDGRSGARISDPTGRVF